MDTIFARRADQLPALGENLHHDRRRGEDEPHARDKRHHGRKTQRHPDERQQEPAHRHLQQAKPENLPAQAPQFLRLHFKSDDEQ